MILPFSTQLNGKPTYFIEKIWRSLESNKLVEYEVWEKFIEECELNNSIDYDYLCHTFGDSNKGKIHTIREDKKNRWKPGILIDFFINCRQKDMFRFAPQISVVSVQEVFMTRRGHDLEITISKVDSYIGGDDFYLYHDAKKQLALNDGFDSLIDFNLYFLERIDENYKQTGNSWFKGKIIHWTDERY